MEALFRKTTVLFIILLEMSYFRSARAFSFLRPQSFTKARQSPFSATSYGMQMSSERGTSVGSKFESWYQKTIKTLSMHEELIPIPLSSEGYDVFNFMAVPRSHLAVPILGIDVVSLPRGSLAAIDFQPHDSDRAIFALEQYTRLKDTHEKYSSALPSGGEIQEETKTFFSPYAIWTRIPPDGQGDSDSSSGGGDLMKTVGEGVDEYVQAYSDLLLQHSTTSSKQSSGISEDFLAKYLSYRIEKDPAKRLLVGAFGNEWTLRVLQQVMFPTMPGTPLTAPTGTPHTVAGADLSAQGGEGEGEGESSTTAVNVPSVITFVTGNAKKRKEVEEILLTYQTSFQLVAEKVDLPELQGEPVEIAIEKCRLAVDTLRRPVITEDTSLCFHALKGLPGPYIKWFLEKLGHEGLNNLLLAYPDKSAYAQCVVAYCEGPGCEIKTFVGRTEGHIVPAAFLPPGPGPEVPVFGWDPIFKPLEFEGTYAQMPKDEKNKISHRYRAFAQLAAYLGGKAL